MARTIAYSAPGRCGILGNPTDIYGGSVLSCSVPTRNACRLDFDEEPVGLEDPRLWNAAVHRLGFRGNVRVTWTSEVPRSSGLSGSTATLASTMACLTAAQGQDPTEDRTLFGELVRDTERHDAGIVCGYQDAHMICHGGLRLMRFTGKSPTEIGPPPVSEAIDAPLPFLLVTTGVERLSGAVHGPMGERWSRGETSVVRGMDRIAALAEPGTEALRCGDLQSFAEAMTENHAIMRDLGGSGESIDRLIARCLAHGAMAAKLAGAGLGGTVIALTEDADSLEASLRGDGYTRFIRPALVDGLRRETVD
ncbi:hypothetical protein EON81_03970 [bacterium]|nr:MAG: hypothetical protein EON81_03970 [bacterium]